MRSPTKQANLAILVSKAFLNHKENVPAAKNHRPMKPLLVQVMFEGPVQKNYVK